MKIRNTLIIAAGAVMQLAGAANSLPVSNAWNVAPSGTATSSGELHFRMTAGDADPVDITVPIMSGTKEASIARYIQRALSSQLRAHDVAVEAGEGANVMVTSPANARFSLELVTSDVENVRVAVRSATPVAPPTVPPQATPANPPPPSTPAAPGDALPPANAAPPANASQPAAPPPSNSPPMPNPSPPPNSTGGSGAPASAPPPNATPDGTPSPSAPPPNGTTGGTSSPTAPPPSAPPAGAPPPTR
jgi:hypothetical protein